LERAQTKADTVEEIYQAYLANNPNKVSSKTIKKATQKPVRDHTLDPLGPPEVGDDGRIRPGKKMVPKKTPPRQPSPQEISKMSVKEIADLIIATRDSLWPGGGGDAEVPGIEAVGMEK
jgi:electron transfer flavoprotein alpha/beta subunit